MEATARSAFCVDHWAAKEDGRDSKCNSADARTVSRKRKRTRTDLFDELAHDAVPLARLGIEDAVLFVGHQFDDVVEADQAGNVFQQVDAETFVTVVAGQVALRPQHDVGIFLFDQTLKFHEFSKAVCVVGTFSFRSCFTLLLHYYRPNHCSFFYSNK